MMKKKTLVRFLCVMTALVLSMSALTLSACGGGDA